MFKITVVKLIPRESKDNYSPSYNSEGIYEQVVETIDIKKVIDAVNLVEGVKP